VINGLTMIGSFNQSIFISNPLLTSSLVIVHHSIIPIIVDDWWWVTGLGNRCRGNSGITPTMGYVFLDGVKFSLDKGDLT
jgi:hypothetical protein